MVVLDCVDVTTALQVVEVLASAKLRLKPDRRAGGTVSGEKLRLHLLREGSRVYVGDLPGADVLDLAPAALIAQLLPRHLTLGLTIATLAAGT